MINTRIFLQASLLVLLLVALDSIAYFEVLPLVKGDTAFGIFTHLLDVFLLVFERGDYAYAKH